jgi:hypothetical protein
MKKRKKYGFKVFDERGFGFTRWFNGHEEQITDKSGKLPLPLNLVYSTQRFWEFHKAQNYCREVSKRYKLRFITLTEEDWNAIEHPVKRFFKQLLKK